MGVKVNDTVVVFGLESQSGRELNGKTGLVTRYDAEKGRFEVRFDHDRLVFLRPENLSSVTAGAGELRAGDHVEVFGLSSESGRELNGQRGVATRPAQGTTERWEVRFEGPARGEVRLVNLKTGNLRRLPRQDAEHSSGPSFSSQQGCGGLRAGDLVEVSGLTSEAGQQLNGEQGTVTGVDEERGRVEVRFDELGGRRQSLRPQHLRKLDLMIGDLVEVVGLESAQGEKLNGDKGSLKRFVAETGRWEVEFLPRRLVSLRAANLQRVDTAPLEGRA